MVLPARKRPPARRKNMEWTPEELAVIERRRLAIAQGGKYIGPGGQAAREKDFPFPAAPPKGPIVLTPEEEEEARTTGVQRAERRIDIQRREGLVAPPAVARSTAEMLEESEQFLSPEDAEMARRLREAKARPGEEAASRARLRELGPGYEDVGGVYRRKGPTVEELQAGAAPVSPELKAKYEGLSPRAREKQTELGTRGSRLKEQADRYQVEADDYRKRAAGLHEQGKTREAQALEGMADKRERSATNLSAQARDVMEKARGQMGWIGGRPAGLGAPPGARAAAGTIGAWDAAAKGEEVEELVQPKTAAGLAQAETVSKLKKVGYFPPGPEGEAQYRALHNAQVREADLPGLPKEGAAPGMSEVDKIADNLARTQMGIPPGEALPPERMGEYLEHYRRLYNAYAGVRAGEGLPPTSELLPPPPAEGEPAAAGGDLRTRLWETFSQNLPISHLWGGDKGSAPAAPTAGPAPTAPATGLRPATSAEKLAAVQQVMPGYQTGTGTPIPPEVKQRAEQILNSQGLTAGP